MDRPRLTLKEAAAACGVSLSTIRRRRDAGSFPHAVRDAERGWLIPVEDLLAAGLQLHAPAPPEVPAESAPVAADVRALLEQLAEARADAAAARAEATTLRWVIASKDAHLTSLERQVLMLTSAPTSPDTGERRSDDHLSDAHDYPLAPPMSTPPDVPKPRWWRGRSARRNGSAPPVPEGRRGGAS